MQDVEAELVLGQLLSHEETVPAKAQTQRFVGHGKSGLERIDAALAGNIGPPLIAMQSRYPDKTTLRAQIWDATAANPQSAMPPFGKHGIITPKELDQVVEFVWTL